MLIVTACGSEPTTVRVTIASTQIGAGAPVYTATASLTPSNTPTATNTATATSTSTVTPTLTNTPTVTNTPTATLTPTYTPTPTASFTPTPELVAPTAVNLAGAPPATDITVAEFSFADGWSCGDFPCEDDIEGFLERIRVPVGFDLAHVGQFKGQVVQIAYAPDGRLFATVLEDGTRSGAVYVMNEDGTSTRYSDTIISPNGLAFQPATDILYVSGRTTLEDGGALYRVESNGNTTLVIDDLPCCDDIIGNQPNGLTFGADGLIYIGVGALTDRAESPNPGSQPFAEIQPNEAAILRINPHTGEITEIATGIRNPFDIAFDSDGQLYATDIGLVTGEGDRILQVETDANYGFPYYRTRGCSDCPTRPASLDIAPDLLRLPAYTIPHGLTAYTGTQFPANMQDTLFVALWNTGEWGQQILWLDPSDPSLNSEEYQPHPFVTGLIRPTDVIVAPDGSLVVADFIYGHVWRVSYTGSGGGFTLPIAPTATETSGGGFIIPTNTPTN